MRTVITAGNNGRRRLLIKSAERTHHQQMARALERTLSHCSDIHAECVSGIENLRETARKEGFSHGFRHFFSQIVSLLDNYEKLHHQQMKDFRDSLLKALKTSLHDPVVVERIIFYLQEACAPERALNIIIPRGVSLSDRDEADGYQFTDDNHITVTNGTDVIRFPCEMLCQQWLSQAEIDHNSHGQDTEDIFTELMAVISAKLQLVSVGKGQKPPNIKEN